MTKIENQDLYNTTDDVGTIRYYRNEYYHRSDGPAIIYTRLHREDGPAVIYADGGKYWFFQGKLHRTDGPAIDHYECQEWYLDGHKIDCNSQKKFEQLLKLKAFW